MKLNPQCPTCKDNDSIIPIKYGMPSPLMWALHDRKMIHIGGCKDDEQAPRHYCTSCKNKINVRNRKLYKYEFSFVA